MTTLTVAPSEPTTPVHQHSPSPMRRNQNNTDRQDRQGRQRQRPPILKRSTFQGIRQYPGNARPRSLSNDVQDTVYGTNEEFNTLFYDIEQNLDSEASEEQVPDQASISKSVISTFMHTQQNTQSVCLAQVNGKVKRMWVKALFKSDPKINPNFALDMPTYKKTTDVHSFHSTVIHATYLHSDSKLSSDPQFQLHFDGTVTASTLTGLPLHTLLDTGWHKTLLSKKIYDQNKKHFEMSMKSHFWKNIL